MGKSNLKVRNFRTITGITNDVVADLFEDTLTLASGNNLLSILGNAGTDTITFTVNEGNISHNALADLQGGVADEYYHLTSAEHTAFGSLIDNSVVNTLHRHSELVNPSGSIDPALSVDASGYVTIGGNLSAYDNYFSEGSGQIGVSGSGNRAAFLSLYGDDTSYGIRLVRGNTGINAYSQVAHKGTGDFKITGEGAASILLQTNSLTRMTIDAGGNITQADGLYFATDEVRARDAGGLYLRDDGGNLGIFIKDGGDVGIGTASPTYKFDVVKVGGRAQSGIYSENDYPTDTVYGNNGVHARWSWTIRSSTENYDMRLYNYMLAVYAISVEGSTNNVGLGTYAPTEKLDINSDAIRIRTPQTPASAGAAGTQGMICWDTSYIYVCVAANTWERAALSSW